MNRVVFVSEVEHRDFLDLAKKVHPDMAWIDVAHEPVRSILEGRSPFLRHCDTTALICYRNHHPVARMLLQIDHSFNSHWKRVVGHILFFEALEDQHDSVAALFESAFEWFKGRSVTLIRSSYLHGRQLPLAIDSYSEKPSVCHSGNPSYYHNYLKENGFRTECGMGEFRVTFQELSRDAYCGFIQRSELNDVQFRTFNLNDMEGDTELLRDLHNKTFSNHWGATQLDNRDTRDLTFGMGPLFNPDLVHFAYFRGSPVGFVYGMPDLHQSSLNHLTSVDIKDNQQINHGLLLMIGVLDSHRGLSIGVALGARLYIAMMDLGYISASYTIIHDENLPSQKAAMRLGAKPSRNYVVYCKEF